MPPGGQSWRGENVWARHCVSKGAKVGVGWGMGLCRGEAPTTGEGQVTAGQVRLVPMVCPLHPTPKAPTVRTWPQAVGSG